MICVFLSFMLGESRVIKEFGLSLASAVFLDAVVVRCLLLPAVLNILGDMTWKIPGWLDRSLPRVNIEGTATHLSPTDEAEFAAFASEEKPVPAGTRGGTED
jgi:RND superfamily putative drug exporter